MKNATEVTLKLLSNMMGDFNDDINFTNKLLLSDRQVSKLCKAFTKFISIPKLIKISTI